MRLLGLLAVGLIATAAQAQNGEIDADAKITELLGGKKVSGPTNGPRPSVEIKNDIYTQRAGTFNTERLKISNEDVALEVEVVSYQKLTVHDGFAIQIQVDALGDWVEVAKYTAEQIETFQFSEKQWKFLRAVDQDGKYRRVPGEPVSRYVPIAVKTVEKRHTEALDAQWAVLNQSLAFQDTIDKLATSHVSRVTVRLEESLAPDSPERTPSFEILRNNLKKPSDVSTRLVVTVVANDKGTHVLPVAEFEKHLKAAAAKVEPTTKEYLRGIVSYHVLKEVKAKGEESLIEVLTEAVSKMGLAKLIEHAGRVESKNPPEPLPYDWNRGAPRLVDQLYQGSFWQPPHTLYSSIAGAEERANWKMPAPPQKEAESEKEKK